MSDFIYIKCPNCHVKIKIDKTKKYHDCSDCHYEFRIDQIADQLDQATEAPAEKKESIFGEFLRENKI